jgi:hypothetical protein
VADASKRPAAGSSSAYDSQTVLARYQRWADGELEPGGQASCALLSPADGAPHDDGCESDACRSRCLALVAYAERAERRADRAEFESLELRDTLSEAHEIRKK